MSISPFLDESTHREHTARNALQSILLLAALGVLLISTSWILGGALGALIAVAAVGLLTMSTPRVPAEAVMRLYRATPLAQDDSQLSSLVDVLAYRAELKARPQLYVVPSMTVNAFAAGTPERPAIAVTEGLLRKMSLREMAGVLAHEMSHIRNNDLEVLGLADVITRILQIFAYAAFVLAAVNIYTGLNGRDAVPWLAILILYVAPAVSSVLQLGLSRAREFDADREAVALTGDATGLAQALARLENKTGRFWEDLMFPVPGRRVPQPSLLRTHPETSDRIKRLSELARDPKFDPLVIVEQPMVSSVGLGPLAMRPRTRWPGVWY